MEIHGNVRRGSTRSIVLFVALISAIALALMAWQTLATHTTAGSGGETTFHIMVGGEQVAHDRSEQGLVSASVGGEQVAHNRSEEGLTDR